MFGDQVIENRDEVPGQPVAAYGENLRGIRREKNGRWPRPVGVAFADIRTCFRIDLDCDEVIVDQANDIAIRESNVL